MNLKLRSLSVAVAVGFVVAGSASRLIAQGAGQGNAGVRAAIEAGNKKFADGAAKHDAALIASAYTEDAEAFPPNSDKVKGRPYCVVWKRVNGQWLLHRDIWTTSLPDAKK